MSDKFVNDIREKTDRLDIPNELSVDNMMDNIEKNRKKRHKRNKVVAALASGIAAMLVIAAGIGLGMVLNGKPKPLMDTKVATASSYDEIYEKIISGIDKSDYSMFSASRWQIQENTAVEEKTDTTDTSDGSSNDFSETNIQVEGVNEADTVITDGKYIYILDTSSLEIRIVDVTDGSMKQAGSIALSPEYSYANEMYVSGDNLVLLAGNYNETKIVTYGISDRYAPIQMGTVTQQGSYSTSRMVGDIIYTFSNYYIEACTRNNCVPTVNNDKMDASDVYYTSDIESASYMVISSVNVQSPNEVMCSKSILGNFSEFYVSTTNIYVTSDIDYKTQIIRLSYEDGVIEGQATGQVDGFVNDSFSMDENNGYLRMVTTEVEHINDGKENDFNFDIAIALESSSNNVYILNSNLETTGVIKDIASGEQIYSARFMGNYGYFVTYRQIDPLFCVDLSDPANPKIVSELKVTGFSEYLHFWKEDSILGVGIETDEITQMTEGIKLSMFNISDVTNITESAKLVLDKYYTSSIEFGHNTLLIDDEKNIIGMMAEDETDNYECFWDYIVLGINDAGEFEVKLTAKVELSECVWETRGIYIGEKLYIVVPDVGVRQYSISDYTITNQIEF